MPELFITSGTLATLMLEGIKAIIRYIKKDPTMDFPTAFYSILLPVLNAISPFVMLSLGLQVSSPILEMNLVGVLRYLALVIVNVLVSLVVYNNGIKPLKEYNKTYTLLHK